MQNYKRKITYFYCYLNGNVGSTAGFLKLEIRQNKVKITINIQESSYVPYKEATLYFYHEAGEHLSAIKVDQVKNINGVLTYQVRTDWQHIFDTGRDLYTFDGVAVVYNESHYYIGDFQDKERKDYELVLRNKGQESSRLIDSVQNGQMIREDVEGIRQSRTETMFVEETQGKSREAKKENVSQINAGESKEKITINSEEVRREIEPKSSAEETKSNSTKGISIAEAQGKSCEKMFGREKELFEQCEECPYRRSKSADKEYVDAYEKMLSEYPKLPMYQATEFCDCGRIHPRDIGKLDIRNWKLGVNSFLTHGYYTYQYLLLGKLRFDGGSDRAIIGVPGVFSNREKYLANMFGFEQFIPIKKTGVKTGEFGYWIVEISPYL